MVPGDLLEEVGDRGDRGPAVGPDLVASDAVLLDERGGLVGEAAWGGTWRKGEEFCFCCFCLKFREREGGGEKVSFVRSLVKPLLEFSRAPRKARDAARRKRERERERERREGGAGEKGRESRGREGEQRRLLSASWKRASSSLR